MSKTNPRYWPPARHFTEAIQCPSICFSNHLLRETLPAVDRLGLPLVTSGQFAYVYKLKSASLRCDFAVRCFRSYLGDRDQRYRALQAHIQTYPLPFLSGFTYEPEGILVGGQRFPILFMKWIKGSTLDLYLDEMVGRREVLLHLADEWLKLIKALREASIAHGDLQHGNIIVEHGKLRLVDHDGMFVPQMAGWTSSELGHQHYQHPRRDAQLFDSNLDNFSALVIYLSFLSLAEQPALWAKYHDENLIFRKEDFLAPASSELFAQIRSLSEEHRRLADILAAAATGEPSAVPFLLDLTAVKSALPAWVNSPLDLESKIKTREVMPTAPAQQNHDSRWTPWQAKSSTASMPSTPPSSTVQTIFGGATTPNPSSAAAKIRDPSEVSRNTLIFAKELLGKNFIWWYWTFYVFLQVFDFGIYFTFFIALACLASICLTHGFIRARAVARAALTPLPPMPPPPLTSFAPASFPAPAANHLRKSTAHHLPPDSITAAEPIIGNRLLSIYHRPDCDWVAQILPKNRTSFSSPANALSAGYKPCRICLP